MERDIHNRLERSRQGLAEIPSGGDRFDTMSVPLSSPTSSGAEGGDDQKKKSCKHFVFHPYIIAC